jgi:hypothetical protein
MPSKKVDGYVSRMDFYQVLEIEHQEAFFRHSEGDRFMPLKRLSNNEINDIATQLRETITSHLDFDSSAVDMIDYSFGEILDNVLMHSYAPDTQTAT